MTLYIVGGFLANSLFVFILIFLRSQCLRRLKVNTYETVYNDVLFTSSPQYDAEGQLVGESDLHMRDSDIWSHSYRMYFIGQNSISFPWFIPQNFPNDALHQSDKERLLQFISRDQWTLDWTICQRQIYYFIRILFPYMSDWFHRIIRRKHFKDAQCYLYQQFDMAHWEDRSGKTVRLSCDSQNFQLAYIDFLDYSKKKKDYTGP